MGSGEGGARIAIGARQSCFRLWEQELEPGNFGKRPKIAIARNERDCIVHAALRYERVAQSGFSFFPKDLRPQPAGPLPIPGVDCDEWNIRQGSRGGRGKRGIAEQFRQYCRYHDNLPVVECLAENLDVIAGGPLQKSDPGAGIGSDHRSAFRLARDWEKRTRPRSCSNRA